MSKQANGTTTAVAATVSTVAVVELPVSKRDAEDLRWFWNDAEGEMTPPSTFSAFECQFLGGQIAQAHAEASEPSDAELRAAARFRKIAGAMTGLSHDEIRALQRWCMPLRYLDASVRHRYGVLGHVMTLIQPPGVVAVWSARLDRKEEGNLAHVERQAAKSFLTRTASDATALLAQALLKYAKARAADHAATKARPSFHRAQLELILGGIQ
jgi:hypothetical protein